MSLSASGVPQNLMKIGCTLPLESFKGDVDQFYNGSRSQNLDLGSWTPGAKQTRP